MHGAMLRLLTPLTTPTTPRAPGNQETENELLLRMSRRPPTPSSPSTTSTARTNTSTPRRPTSSEPRWPSQGLGLGFTCPTTTATTLSLLFGETQYPSLPREGAMSHQSHLGSGQTSPMPVTAPQSPLEDNNNNKTATLLAPRRSPRGHGILPRHEQGGTFPLRDSYRRGNHGQGPRQPKSGTLWSPSRPPMPRLTGTNRRGGVSPPRAARAPRAPARRATLARG